jgi:1-acyl-sn-glycerol-3-phosphate acyltransferase
MKALRSALYLVFLTVTVIPWAMLSFLVFPFPPKRRYLIITQYTTFAIWGAKVFCGIDYTVVGRENIPDPEKHGGVIFLSKHQSRYETLLFRSLFVWMCYVYKRELHYLPFFGWGIALCDMLPIDRARGQEAMDQVARKGKVKLAQGWNMILFPEGTRVDAGQKKRYKLGGTHLSNATGVTVIPIAHNAGDVWPRGSFIKHPGMVTVSIGPPIKPDGLTPDQQMAQVEAWIETEMRTRFPHQYGNATTMQAPAP